MLSKIKVNSAWRTATLPYCKVSTVWKPAKAAYVQVDGTWRNWFLQGGVNDASFATYDISNKANGAVGSISSAQAMAIQTDGKKLLVGAFIIWNGVTVNRIVRLNADDTVDTAFTTNTGAGPNSNVFSIALQTDGKILVGGAFSTWNGLVVSRIIRLNSDGTLDTAFNTSVGVGANGSIYAIALQTDGKIVLGGAVTTWNAVTVGRIVRLNVDGTRDTAFTTNTGTGANATVSSIALQTDGKILVGGAFVTWNAVTVGRIVRLDSTGTRDTAFTTNAGTGANASVFSIALQTDGKIVLGGNFTTWNGTTVGSIVRLDSTGARDTAFTTNAGTGANNNVYSVAVQLDGKIVLGGNFTTWNAVTVGRIVRLDSTGARDTAFTTNAGTGPNSSVYSVVSQTDGKILVGGNFSAWSAITANYIMLLDSTGAKDTASRLGSYSQGANAVIGTSAGQAIVPQTDGKILVGGSFTFWNGTAVGSIVRLNADGTLDTAFTTNTGTGANSNVISVAVQADGKIVLGGAFTAWNGATVGRIVRLNSDGTRDTAFTTNTGTGASSNVISVAVQADGKIVLGGAFNIWNAVTVGYIVRLNSDGTRDTAFTTNTGTGAVSGIFSVAIQADGKILVVGTFITWNAVTVGYIVRLNVNGTRDTAFTTNNGTGANNALYSIVVQPDGKIVVNGFFSTWNGVTVGSIVRLDSTGARDTAFTTNNGTGANSTIYSVALQTDGKIVLGGNFNIWNGTTVGSIVRLDSTGTRDTAFTTNTGTGPNSLVYFVAVQPEGKILVGGNFTGFNQINRSYLARIGGEIAI